MAMNYQNFASLGVNLNRQKYGPLDISNVFTSEADLKYYLTKGTFIEGVSEYWYKNANEKIVPYPYEGQVLATVIDGVVSVYALSLDAEGNFQTQEIGAKVEADGKTIKLNDGKLELVGLPTDTAGKTYVPSYVNGVLTWAEPDTSTAEGQAQEIDGLKTRAKALEDTINGTGEGESRVPGLVEKVAANAQAVVDEASARAAADKAITDAIGEVAEDKTVVEMISDAEQSAKDYTDGLASNYDASGAAATALQDAKDYADSLAGNYDVAGAAATAEQNAKDYADSLAGNYDAAGSASAAETAAKAYADGLASNYDASGSANTALESAKSYTDEQITGLDVVIEKKDDVEHIVIKNAAGAEVASVNASKFVQDSFLNDVAYDSATGKVTFTWSMGDGSTKTDEIDIKHLVDTYTAGNGLKVENNEFAIDTSIVATVEALNGVKATAEAAQTAEQVSAAIDAKIQAENLAQYAKTADVEAELGKKVDKTAYDADKATFATKSEVETGLAGKVDKATLEGYYTKTEIDNHGFAVATEVANTYATKAELENHEKEIANDLLAYAKTADVNTELAKKIEAATIAHAVAADPENGIEAISEGITKEGTTLKIVVDAPTRAETTQMIADKVAAVTGGESAAAVKLLVEAEAERSIAKDDAHDAAIAKLTGEATVAGSVAEAKALAQKGVDDAAKVANDLATANTNIGKNANEIDVVKGTITTVNETLSGKVTELVNKDIELAGQISGLDTAVKGNATTIGEHTAAITALQAKDTELAGQISGVDAKFASYTDTEGMNKAIDDKIAAIPATDLSAYAKTADVNSALDLKANAADVYTKDAADAAFMTQDEVDARIDALIAASDPDGDGNVIKNIQNLVEYVENNAGEITALVTATDANTDKLAGIDSTVTKYVEDQIKTVVTPKASEEVTVAEDGTLGIGKVNIAKLFQGEEDVLILNGGSASTAV